MNMKPLIYDLIKGKIKGQEQSNYDNQLYELFSTTYDPYVNSLKISDNPNIRIYNLIHSSKSGDGYLKLYPNDFTGLIFMITKTGGYNGQWRVQFRDHSGEEYEYPDGPGVEIDTDTWYIVEKINDSPMYHVEKLTNPAIVKWKAPEQNGPAR